MCPFRPSAAFSSNLNVMLRICADLGFSTDLLKQFLLQRTLWLLASNRILSPRNFSFTLRHYTKRQIQSLVAKLTFICTVCSPGRTLLCRMLDVLCKAQHPAHHLRLNHAFHKDLLWWRIFLPSWNCCSFFYEDKWTPSSNLDLYTDACQFGFGAYFAGDWRYGSFADHDVPLSSSITFKELFSITAAVNT